MADVRVNRNLVQKTSYPLVLPRQKSWGEQRGDPICAAAQSSSQLICPRMSLTLLLRSVSLNWKLISPCSQIFFFGGNLCGFYVLDSSILGEYVTLSVKLYILPAALPSNKKQFARKTLYFEHQAGGVGAGGWRGHPTNMDFRLPPAPSSTDSAQPTSKGIQISSDNVKQLQNQDRGFMYYLK